MPRWVGGDPIFAAPLRRRGSTAEVTVTRTRGQREELSQRDALLFPPVLSPESFIPRLQKG